MKLLLSLALIAGLAVVAGCESIGYYGHVAGGQIALLASRRPVARVLETLDDEADAPLKARLIESQQMLDFAEDRLGLEVGRRYRTYVALDRPNVVWNLFAAPTLSLSAHTWCYPFVGCAPYRGYFDRDRALAQAARLEADGFDTYVGGVAAYSTLGWFDDPLLSSFIGMPEPEFAELLFHELAHSRVWVKGDVTFNESFASFVGETAMGDWLEHAGHDAELEGYQQRRRFWRAARGILFEVRDALAALYAGGLPRPQQLEQKEIILDAGRACIGAVGSEVRVRRVRALQQAVNNAYLASLATYSDALPAFRALFEQAGANWQQFFDSVEELARLPDEQRQVALRSAAEDHIAAEADDQGADQVQCKALARHGLDREVPG